MASPLSPPSQSPYSKEAAAAAAAAFDPAAAAAAAAAAKSVDWDRPPEEELPSYRDAAMNAWAKAKEVGAGKFTPGGLGSEETAQPGAAGGESHERLRAPIGTAHDASSQPKKEAVPPPVRSVVTFCANASMAIATGVRATPGLQGALFYQNRSYCFASGFRDAKRGMDSDDKGNFLRIKDPIGVHHLTTVFFGHLVWMLHREGHIDMFAPLSTMLPELGADRKFDGLFARDILAHSAAMDDREILAKVFDISSPRSGANYFATVTEPINRALAPPGIADPLPSRAPGSEMEAPPRFGSCGSAPAGGADATTEVSAAKMGMAMRQRLVARIGDAAPRLGRMFKPTQRSARPSHFALALLAAAVERKMGGEPMEELFRQRVTEPLGIMSIGFGIPQIIYRSSMFWQPSGLPHAHFSLDEHIKPGDTRHSASPVFNASLNLFGNPEDVARLLCDVFTSVREAVEKLPQTTPTGSTAVELGWTFVPHKRKFVCKEQWWSRRRSPVEYAPYSAAAVFDDVKGAGAYCAANCGNTRAMVTANIAAQLISQVFIRQCIDTGMDLQATSEIGRENEPQPPPAARKPPAAAARSAAAPGTVSETKEGKSWTSPVPAAPMADVAKKYAKLSKDEQVAEMQRMSEEQRASEEKESRSLFSRATNFFKTGQIFTSEHKKF